MRYTSILVASFALTLTLALAASFAGVSSSTKNPRLADKYAFTAVSIFENYETEAREALLTSRMLYMEYEVHLTEKSFTGEGDEFRMAGSISVLNISDDTDATSEELFNAICGGRIDFVASYDAARSPQIDISAKCNGAEISEDTLITKTIASLLEPAADFDALVERSSNGVSRDGRSLRVIESDRRERRNAGLASGGLTERRWSTAGPTDGTNWRLASVSYYDYPSTRNSRYSVVFRISGRATD